MPRILGSRKQLCNGVSRRELLLAAGLGALSLGTGDLIGPQPAQAARPRERSFGRAKNVILLYLFGGPSHLETFDMKPDAAPEVRGELRPIRSRLPGCDVCEHLPNLAKVMDRACVVRS